MTLVPYVPTKLQLLGGLGIAMAAGAIFTFMHLQQSQQTTLRAKTVEPNSSNQQKTVASEPVADVTINGQKVDGSGTTHMKIPGGGTATVTVSGNNSTSSKSSSTANPIDIDVNNSSSGSSTSVRSYSSTYNSSSGGGTSSRNSSRVNVSGSGSANVEVQSNH